LPTLKKEKKKVQFFDLSLVVKVAPVGNMVYKTASYRQPISYTCPL